MDVKQAVSLLQRYRNGDATPAEVQLVKEWYQRMVDSGEWNWAEGEKEALESAMEHSLLQRIGQEGESRIQSFSRVHLPRRMRWVAAASVILLLGAGSYMLFLHKPQPVIAKTQTQQQRFRNDVAPGGNKATLTLANGKTIVLDSAANGMLARQGNANVQKLANGQLAYNVLHEKPAGIVYNTLTTPRGGQYRLTLPDGSAVWLNAASSIKYPVPFSGTERAVEITGEAYFEVVHDPKMPFRVDVKGMEVMVLGTHFNINAYGDEPMMKTSLLSGAVRISEGGQERLLKPGQQAQVANGNAGKEGGMINVVNNADMEEVMAWKNGMFRFRDEGLESVMRQIARWYDVNIEYQGRIPDYPFVGRIPRSVPVSEMLKLLELTDVVHFSIDGRKITVTP